MITHRAVARMGGKKNFRGAICALSAVLVLGQVPVLAEGTGSYGAQPVALEGSSLSNVSEKEILDILVPGGDEPQASPYGRETVKKSGTQRKSPVSKSASARKSPARKATVSSANKRDKVRIAAREAKRIDDVIKNLDETKNVADKPAVEKVLTEEKTSGTIEEKNLATQKAPESTAAEESTQLKSDAGQPKESRRARLLSKFKKLRVKKGGKATAAGPESETLPANVVKEPEKDLKTAQEESGAEAKSTEPQVVEQPAVTDEAPKAEAKDAQTADAAIEPSGAREGDDLAMKPPADVADQAVAGLSSQVADDGPVVIDNDEVVEQKESIEYTELPTVEGKTRIRIGARFPVVLSSQITSKTAKKGDPIEGRLKYDLKINDKLIAKKGSVVRGHLNYALKARTILHSLVSPERWYRNSGCLGIDFDEIINERGEHIPCKAGPSRMGRIVKNKAEGRELGVNHHGQIAGPWAQQLRYKAIRIGLNFAMAPAGVFSFGAMPVALGVIGAANPNFAFSKPVGLNVRHRRIKGFAWGFLSGIPGSWLIEDTTVKGQEAVIKPGDEFLAEFKQEFTGEPETDASLLSGASTNVKGQVVPSGKKSKKKK